MTLFCEHRLVYNPAHVRNGMTSSYEHGLNKQAYVRNDVTLRTSAGLRTWATTYTLQNPLM